MISRIPIIGYPISYSDIICAIACIYDKNARRDFSRTLSEFINLNYSYLTNSGISSFYIILQIIKKKYKKKEIIIPAYTAESLVVAILKAGLKPVLCDVSTKDFNLDADSSSMMISKDTLAVVCVHMFGIGMADIVQLKDKMPPCVFLIEDCAQAMGSKIDEKQVGSFGDVSFFSFNRGKNLPVYGGGCIATDSKELAETIEDEIQKLPEQSLLYRLSIPFKILALSLAVRPSIYGLIYPLASHFKDVSLPHDFESRKITKFQARMCLNLLKKIDDLSLKRYQNGMFLIKSLKFSNGIIIPEIQDNSQPAFNRLPVVFKDLSKLERVEKKLWDAGIDTSRMYLKPLHHIFDLGYKKEDFPNANYLAEHLLTLPVHPLVRESDLLRIVEVIKGI